MQTYYDVYGLVDDLRALQYLEYDIVSNVKIDRLQGL
tara:strand:- start:136 stop:246 length:111 start_codon:yes stop_codon:yes gene_type:complete